jgi:hypothetical protein
LNRQHFLAFVWLRWRLRVNQLKRGGTANLVILIILYVGAGGLAVVGFVLSLLAGLFAFTEAPAGAVLFAWDALVVAFLFLWALGLLADLQRAEPLSLDRVLHLPVSPSGAFVINYLSSLFGVTLGLFLSAALGLAIGLAVSSGPAFLAVFPLLAAFVFAVTAPTYQFQGWLAALMSNPRRRRTVIVLLTAVFVLSCQLPNLVNYFQPWNKRRADDSVARLQREVDELQHSLAERKITLGEFRRRVEELEREHQARVQQAQHRTLLRLERWARLANLALPPGWLPLGAEAAAEGNSLPALLGTAGLLAIGAASLWRAYQTTVRIYTGRFNFKAGPKAAAAAAAPAPVAEALRAKTARPSAGLLEKPLPWVSEQAAAIALGGFTSLLRAPEGKMMLVTPIILGLVFGSMLVTSSASPPPALRPVMAFAGMAMVLLSLLQLAGNQFGFDRAGFRVFVLGPAPRREVLLGKNLALAPLPLAWGVLLLTLLQVLYPMRIDHLLAAVPQLVSMYLLFCLMANWLSIFAPIPIAPGSFKASHVRVVPVLAHLAFVFLFPVALAPTLLPLGVELVLEQAGWGGGAPVCLVLSVGLCAAVVLLYRLVLGWQGQVLQLRERKILKEVTAKD